VCVCVNGYRHVRHKLINKLSNNQQLTFSGPERTAKILWAKLQPIHVTQL